MIDLSKGFITEEDLEEEGEALRKHMKTPEYQAHLEWCREEGAKPPLDFHHNKFTAPTTARYHMTAIRFNLDGSHHSTAEWFEARPIHTYTGKPSFWERLKRRFK